MSLIKLVCLVLVRGAMTRRIKCLGLALVLVSAAVAADESDTGVSAAEPLLTVLNPTGIAPALLRKSMAARPASLDGKTVYLVDVTFNSGDLFLLEMQKWMAANMPEVNAIFRVKKGSVYQDDPELWREMQAADALMVMAIGH